MNSEHFNSNLHSPAIAPTNPPVVNLTPPPIGEHQFKQDSERQEGQARALKLQLQAENNRSIGWDIATQRENNQTKALKYSRSKESGSQERHKLAGDKIDTETARKAIEQNRLKGKISATQTEQLQIELGGKHEENKYLGGVRALQQKKHALALKVGELELAQLQTVFDQRRALLRQQGQIRG